MGTCINHPDKETNYLCMKHNIYLCEECLKCRDPEIHCKFRPSCPIWFLDKSGGKGIDDIQADKKIKVYKVIFKSESKDTVVSEGSTLLEAAQAADVPLNASCNGKGVCGKCRLVLESGNVDIPETSFLTDEEKEKKYFLACQSTVHGDVVVNIPEETREKKLKVAGMGKEATDKLKGLVKEIHPMFTNISLTMDPPTFDDTISDLDRLNRGLVQKGWDTSRLSLGLKVIRDLSKAMQHEDFNVTASIIEKNCSNEIVSVVPGKNINDLLGLAIDVGTTSIVVYLVDMSDGTIISATSGHNRQAACGDDVINRIVCAEKDGVKKLSKMVLATINGLINEAISSAEVDRNIIHNVVISGNTTMTHLLLQIEPRNIRREPYIPTVSGY